MWCWWSIATLLAVVVVGATAATPDTTDPLSSIPMQWFCCNVRRWPLEQLHYTVGYNRPSLMAYAVRCRVNQQCVLRFFFRGREADVSVRYDATTRVVDATFSGVLVYHGPANIDLQPGMQRAILLSFYYRLLQANIGHPMMLSVLASIILQYDATYGQYQMALQSNVVQTLAPVSRHIDVPEMSTLVRRAFGREPVARSNPYLINSMASMRKLLVAGPADALIEQLNEDAGLVKSPQSRQERSGVGGESGAGSDGGGGHGRNDNGNRDAPPIIQTWRCPDHYQPSRDGSTCERIDELFDREYQQSHMLGICLAGATLLWIAAFFCMYSCLGYKEGCCEYCRLVCRSIRRCWARQVGSDRRFRAPPGGVVLRRVDAAN